MKELIRKHALQNAVKHNGKAIANSVIGSLIQSEPTLKNKIRELSTKVIQVVNNVNSMSLEEQIKELQKIAPEALKKKTKEHKKGLKELTNIVKNMVFRFSPSASGPLHVGHAIVLSLNYLYAKKYNGKLILRIEDTNPENTYEDSYDLIEDYANWLTKNSLDKIVIQSSRLKIYHDYCETLIATGKAYVCKCSEESFKKLKIQKKTCPCREVPKQKQLVEWRRMFKDLKQGEAVVRIKTDLKHKNPAMRDWPAMRINDHPHPKVKNRVWPLMNFSVAIDDHEMKITHTIRGKDHMDNAKKQKNLFEYFQWKEPTHLFVGRINFKGLNLSTSKIRKLILEGKFEGWEDIRLPFLGSLRRRGYQPEAFHKFVEDLGITQNDKTITKGDFFKLLNSYNKELLEKSNRYFFIEDPVELTIKNAPEQEVKIELHPDHPDRGYRVFKTSDKFYISKKDTLKKDKLYRLMDCLNFKNKKFDSLEYENYKKKGYKILHWLPKSNDLIAVEVRMPDNNIVKGVGEKGLNNLKEGDIVQFERFGFCRLDKRKGETLEFWYAHN